MTNIDDKQKVVHFGRKNPESEYHGKKLEDVDTGKEYWCNNN